MLLALLIVSNMLVSLGIVYWFTRLRRLHPILAGGLLPVIYFATIIGIGLVYRVGLIDQSVVLPLWVGCGVVALLFFVALIIEAVKFGQERRA